MRDRSSTRVGREHARWRGTAWCLVLVLWMAATGAGFFWLGEHANTPGRAADPIVDWPADAPFRPSRERPTLLFFAHPRCPCTRASVRELDRLVARVRDRIDVRVLFVESAEMGPSWTRSTTWRAAEAIPGVEPRADRDGSVARLFGAHTSGQVMLYGPRGQLWFHGGITPGRGHEGDNAGREAILLALNSGAAAPTPTAVYGCPLHDPGSEAATR